MLEFDEKMAFYICDACVDLCAGGETCGGDWCRHTSLPNHAANQDSVKLLNNFFERFEVTADEYGRLVCVEKG